MSDPPSVLRPARTTLVGLKLLVTSVSLAATLGGWALLSHGERERRASEAARAHALTPTRVPLPTVMPAPSSVVDRAGFAAGRAVPHLEHPPIPDLPPP